MHASYELNDRQSSCERAVAAHGDVRRKLRLGLVEVEPAAEKLPALLIPVVPERRRIPAVALRGHALRRRVDPRLSEVRNGHDLISGTAEEPIDAKERDGPCRSAP